MTAKWIPFPHPAKPFRYPGEKLAESWAALHHGDREPLPAPARLTAAAKKHADYRRWLEQAGGAATVAEQLLESWRHFHAGEFGAAIELGARLGPHGATVANKACGVYTTYLERDERRARELLEAAIARGEAAVRLLPDYANAHYMLAFVLGRYSQRISIVEALAKGHATQVRDCLERTLKLEPKHADAHIALGLFHAEVIGKVGSLVGRMTYGASADDANEHFKRALKLAPESAIAHVEYAQGLRLLDARGDAARAAELLAAAAQLTPGDAMEKLDVERAKRGKA
jgi:tetratricopeptide (TPR) repeat protein